MPTDKPIMELRYPRSFLALLLVGFMIVALPLIAGLISNAWSIERLSVQSQKAVQNAAAATQDARQLAATTLAMERSARNDVVLIDLTVQGGGGHSLGGGDGETRRHTGTAVDGRMVAGVAGEAGDDLFHRGHALHVRRPNLPNTSAVCHARRIPRYIHGPFRRTYASPR